MCWIEGPSSQWSVVSGQWSVVSGQCGSRKERREGLQGSAAGGRMHCHFRDGFEKPKRHGFEVLASAHVGGVCRVRVEGLENLEIGHQRCVAWRTRPTCGRRGLLAFANHFETHRDGAFRGGPPWVRRRAGVLACTNHGRPRLRRASAEQARPCPAPRGETHRDGALRAAGLRAEARRRRGTAAPPHAAGATRRARSRRARVARGRASGWPRRPR